MKILFFLLTLSTCTISFANEVSCGYLSFTKIEKLEEFGIARVLLNEVPKGITKRDLVITILEPEDRWSLKILDIIIQNWDYSNESLPYICLASLEYYNAHQEDGSVVQVATQIKFIH